MKVLLSILLFALLPDPGDEKRFLHVTQEFNLSQSYINDIAKDSLGYIWFAGTAGLTRFAGDNAYHYDSGSDKNILSVKEINGRLWATSRKGQLYLYDYSKDNFRLCASTTQGSMRNIYGVSGEHLLISGTRIHHYDVVKDSLTAVFHEPGNYFRSIVRLGHHFFVASSRGIYKLAADAPYSEFRLDTVLLKGEHVVALALWGNRLLAGTDAGMFYILSENGEVLHTKTFRNEVMSAVTVREITYASDSIAYLGVDQIGLVKVDLVRHRYEIYTHDPDVHHSLSTNSIHKIFVDDGNRIWIGTYGRGVDLLDPNRKPFSVIQHEVNNSNSLTDNLVRCVFEDSDHNFWFGTENGLSKYSPVNDKWTNFSLADGLNSHAILSLSEWQNKIVVGTYGGGINLVDKINNRITAITSENEPSCPDFVFTCFTDKKSNLWFGGQDGKFTRISPDYKFSFINIPGARTIIEDHTGDILVGTPNGVYAIDRETNSTRKIHIKDEDAPASLRSTSVRTLFEDSVRNCLWIGMDGGGLSRYDYLTQTYTHFDIEDGLSSNMVYSVITDNHRDLWIGTNRGITKFNPEQELFFVYTKEDGLPTNDFSFGNAIRDTEDHLLIASASGVVRFFPEAITTDQEIPLLYLANLSVSGKDIDPETFGSTAKFLNNLKFPSKQNSFTFFFEAIHFGHGEKLQFKYRLAGFDEQWSKPGHLPQVTYNNLSPGDYTLYYTCSNADGIWRTEPLLFSFTITPPFWKSPLAFLIYVILAVMLLAALYSHYKLRHNKILAENRINTFVEIAHDINNLASVIALSAEKIFTAPLSENAKGPLNVLMQNAQRLNRWVKQLIEFRMAETGRMQVKAQPVEMKPYIQNIVAGFTPYLEKKNITVHERIPEKLTLWIDRNKMERVFNNIISNSIKYNYDNGAIEISVDETDTTCTFIIKDNGRGIPDSDQREIFKLFYRAGNTGSTGMESGSGIGLILSKHIIEIHGGTIGFESQLHQGSVFRLVLRKGSEHFEAGQIVAAESVLDIPPLSLLQDGESNSTLVLIVEDNPDLRNALAGALCDTYQVITAQNGEEGLLYAVEKMPDLIISDIMMDGMTGMELCHKLKNDLATNHIPVILLTALDSEEHKIEGLKTGADAYLEKPFNITLLQVTMNNLLNQRKRLKEYFHNNPDDVNNRAYNSPVNHFLQNVIRHIKANLKIETYDIDALCREIGISRSVFFRKVKSITGLTPSAFVLQVKLNHAAELLKQHGDIKVVDVAWESGFKNNAYFSTIFKNHFGCSPSEFRKQHMKVPTDDGR